MKDPALRRALGEPRNYMPPLKRILIVDDEPRDAILLENILISLGYKADTANSGQEALDKLNSEVDLVLLDVLMPGLTGFQVCREIRRRPEFVDLPVIMVTVLDGREERLRAVQAGANDFISKPVDKLELHVRLGGLLKMKEARDTLKRQAVELEALVEERTAVLSANEARCRKLYEESKEREELYQSFLTASVDAVAVYDLQGKLKYVNPAFSRMFGWTAEALEGSVLPDIPYIPNSHRESSVGLIRQILQESALLSGFESKRSCKDGRLLDVSISASRYYDSLGQPAGMIVILRDITEQKRTENALKISEELFRTLFEEADDRIFVKDMSLAYTHVNPAMVKLLNFSRPAIIGRTDEDILGPNIMETLRAQDLRVLRGQSIESEYTMIRNGVAETFNFIKFPLRNAQEEIIGLCGIARDMTDRQRVIKQVAPSPEECVSGAMRETLRQAMLAAETDSTVLLLGENGSGKDFLAHFIHEKSKRSRGIFLNVNCAALSPELAESELFGHEAGAFTGARGRKRGYFELAEGGTLLLNEVGELGPNLQAKLLTFLDSQSFTRVGGESVVTVDVRLVGATNRDLESDIESGKFRKDLFYRLNVFSITVPPLRERLEDLPILVGSLLTKLQQKMGLQEIPKISPAVMNFLAGYHWPGNVRELQNILERALILSNGSLIAPEHLAITDGRSIRVGAPPRPEIRFIREGALPEILEGTKRLLISEALEKTHGSVTAAAGILGITRESLRHHMRQLGLRGWRTTKPG